MDQERAQRPIEEGILHPYPHLKPWTLTPGTYHEVFSGEIWWGEAQSLCQKLTLSVVSVAQGPLWPHLLLQSSEERGLGDPRPGLGLVRV